jgi:uncharacterized protein YndB with AHSA1/START domain
MATPNPVAPYALTLRRTFDAPREKVFRAWTDPQALKQWYAPSDAFQTPVAETDPKVGGRYRIEMIDPEGKRHCVVGRYQEVKAPERLVFTWAWENDEHGTGEDSVVTLEFRDLGGRTEMTLTHERFATEKARDMHEHGHSGCLERLQRLLVSQNA